MKPPTDCPCCGGDTFRHDPWSGTIDKAAKCPACSGTGKAPRGCQSSACAEAAFNRYLRWAVEAAEVAE